MSISMKNVCLIGPEKTGKSKFFNEVSGEMNDDTEYVPSKLVRFHTIKDKNVKILDIPGKPSIFFDNVYTATSSACLAFLDFKETNDFEKFYSYIEHFLETSSENSRAFVAIKNRDTNSENYVAKLMLNGISIFENKNNREIIENMAQALDQT